jgi:probable HAF family extracellular repeat protein
MTDLGTLGGGFSSALGINSAGRVVGFSDTADGERHAFITGPEGVGMTDLGTLGGDFSFAKAINDAGQVVGDSFFAGTLGATHPFITDRNGVGMTDLNTLVHLSDGVVLTEAGGINNMGQLVVTATVIPEPATYALMLAGLALLGVVAGRGSRPHRHFSGS